MNKIDKNIKTNIQDLAIQSATNKINLKIQESEKKYWIFERKEFSEQEWKNINIVLDSFWAEYAVDRITDWISLNRK